MIGNRWSVRGLGGFLALALATTAAPHGAWGIDILWTGNAGDNNWNTAGNWTGGFVPEAEFEEVGVIDNGDTAFLAVAAPDAAGLVLGQSATGLGGLEVRSGGSVNFVESTGAPDGSIVVGLSGQGELTVEPGGSVTGTALSVNGQSSLTIGGAGSASLGIGGSMSLNGTTRVIGPGHTFSGTSATFGGSGTLIAELTSPAHSPIQASGTATLGGTLRPELGGGFVPTPGDAWNLLDASNIFGSFANVDLSAVPLPAPGTAYQVSTVAGGTHGRLLQLQLSTLLQLTVNVDTGGVSLSSPSGEAIEIVGYSILSPSGSLDMSGWNSLQQQLGGGWEEATPTPTALNELQSDPTASLSIGTAPVGLGTPYVFSPTSFGVSPPAVELEYATAAGEVERGLVEFTGTTAFNNLLLTVDPNTGEARLQNSSAFAIDLVGYSVLSPSGSLRPGDGDWLSLADQGLSGWEEAAPTDQALSELIASGTLALSLAPGQSFSLGSPFDALNGMRDLALEFALDGEVAPRLGVVNYAPVAALEGDFNGDGLVDAADYVVWRDGLGTTFVQGDYDVWKQNFGRTAAGSGALTQSAPVPEPASWLLLLGGAAAACRSRRRRSQAHVRSEQRYALAST